MEHSERQGKYTLLLPAFFGASLLTCLPIQKDVSTPSLIPLPLFRNVSSLFPQPFDHNLILTVSGWNYLILSTPPISLDYRITRDWLPLLLLPDYYPILSSEIVPLRKTRPANAFLPAWLETKPLNRGLPPPRLRLSPCPALESRRARRLGKRL